MVAGFAAALGTTNPGTRVRRTVTGTSREIGTTMSDFVVPSSFRLGEAIPRPRCRTDYGRADRHGELHLASRPGRRLPSLRPKTHGQPRPVVAEREAGRGGPFGRRR